MCAYPRATEAVEDPATVLSAEGGRAAAASQQHGDALVVSEEEGFETHTTPRAVQALR